MDDGTERKRSDARVVLEIGSETVALEIFASRAPRAASYFLDLVESGAYDGSSFYRSTTLKVPDGPRLVQAGPLGARLAPDGREAPSCPPPPTLASFETTTDSGLLHESGTLSLARDLFDTGDAISEFFVCLGRFPQLDFGGRNEPDGRGFPAIGQVVEGIDVVGRIAAGKTDGVTPVSHLRGEILSTRVAIDRIFVPGQ